MRVQIREASTPDDREAVFRFRYRVYVEEMGRVQQYVDHRARRVEVPLDRRAEVLAAWDGAEVVGTVRFNYAGRGGLGYYVGLYGMERFAPFFPARTCVTTKLMVASRLRNTTLGLRLCKHGCAAALRDGMSFDF